MKPFKDQPIARKALLLGIVPTVVAILLVISASTLSTYQQARINLVLDLEAESQLVADNMSAPLAFNDQAEASEVLKAYRAKTNVDAVCVYDAQGNLFASFERTKSACTRSTTSVVLDRPSMLGARKVGSVKVAGNYARLYDWTRRQSLVGLGTFVVGVLLSLALTRRLSRDVTVPLQNLTAAADRVSASGDYTVRARKETNDEVGRLVGSFNGMLDQIQEQRDRSAMLLEREKESSRLKDEFLAAVSHELRTPLNAMLGWLQIIRTTKPEPDVMERAIESVERNAHAQARVVEDLIDISRVVTGKLRLQAEPVDLREVVKAALEVVDPAVKAKGVVLTQEMPSEPCMIFGDAARLQQVIWNLFSNAAKFTPGGGTVRVSLVCTPGTVELTVADTGVGISPGFVPFVFDRFRQADGSLTREHGGLGLGLSIAKELTELHGGSLSVSSAGKEQGATFVLKLPRHGVLMAAASV